MNGLKILFKKELLEMYRSYKWVWMPLLFISLGIMQPLTSYYLADIIKEFGGLPEGAVFETPLPTSQQVFTETLGQFSQIGTLVIVLAAMGMLSNERNSGAALMILVKPISYTGYFLSKWLAAASLVIVSFLLGVSCTLYYTTLLFDPLPVKEVMISSGYYVVWLLVTVTITLTLSAFIKKTAAVAGASILILLLLAVAASLFKEPLRWTPGNLLTLAQQAIMNEPLIGSLGTLMVTSVFIAGISCAGIRYMKQGEWLR
ncbi:ABC transporter permease [Jeotgalibacillus sp. S-D1]|uniref:ABC transporter permease n=1 Tax=Jeotgalibacillus sp. S-D1 TaxID=2552189 RepID=UPI001059B821|nr:ABC transporter permease subunit [Jeotgalibacillus sp. S-D1]TDL32075.1 ABC transporter permease [Jeotgalibacillus sp. S-D1]